MSDLPVETATGQPYGEAAEQRRAQEAVPLGGQPALSLPPALRGPSVAPGEPVQTGLASGPGAGPEALAMPEEGRMTEATLKKLYRKYPSRELRLLMSRNSLGM